MNLEGELLVALFVRQNLITRCNGFAYGQVAQTRRNHVDRVGYLGGTREVNACLVRDTVFVVCIVGKQVLLQLLCRCRNGLVKRITGLALDDGIELEGDEVLNLIDRRRSTLVDSLRSCSYVIRSIIAISTVICCTRYRIVVYFGLIRNLFPCSGVACGNLPISII